MQRLLLSWITSCITLVLLASCGGRPSITGGPRAAGSAHPDDAAGWFERAEQLAASGDLPGAFEALGRSMDEAYPTPSDTLTSEGLRPLLDDDDWRPQTRELLRANARESSIAITGAGEPGEPMVLTVRVVGSSTEPPTPAGSAAVRPGVLVGIVQVNAAGYYQPWTPDEDWNPRQFGFAVTDETGTVVVRTVRPGYYAPEYGSPAEPAHVHYNIEQDGTLLRAAEFLFDDDPRLTNDIRREAEEAGIPIASVTRAEDGVWHADVTIAVAGLR